MRVLWIVCANRGFAKIFEVKGHGREIRELHHLDNPTGHDRGAIEFSDRPGRAFDRIGGGRHALENENAHEHEQQLFIQQITTILNEGKITKAFDEIAFVAAPSFLGELNKYISPQIRKCLIKEVSKDLPENISEKDRIEHLRKYLDLWNDSPARPTTR